MTPEEIIESFESIESALKSAQKQIKESSDLKTKKEQLKTVKRSIKQFEKSGIKVPNDMVELANRLKKEVKSTDSSIPELDVMFEKVLDLSVLLGKMCGKAPRRALWLRNKENKENTISSEILSKNLVNTLSEMGGSGHEKEIYIRMEQVLKSQLSDADKECPKVRTPVWISKLRRVRKKLIKEGILTPDSIKKTWKLV